MRFLIMEGRVAVRGYFLLLLISILLDFYLFYFLLPSEQIAPLFFCFVGCVLINYFWNQYTFHFNMKYSREDLLDRDFFELLPYFGACLGTVLISTLPMFFYFHSFLCGIFVLQGFILDPLFHYFMTIKAKIKEQKDSHDFYKDSLRNIYESSKKTSHIN